MKKKILALLLTVALCLSLAVPCFAASLSESEVLSRKRAYYPFINESIKKLYEIRPETKNSKIDRIFANSNNDYPTSDIIESKRSDFSESTLPVSIFLQLTYEGQEYIFINALSNDDDEYEIGQYSHSLFADVYSRDVTKSYATLIDVASGSDTYLKEKIGDGIYIVNGASGDRYLLDIDLNDYQSCGYSISDPDCSKPIVDSSISQTESHPIETPVEQYTKNQEIIISGKTDFGYYYTYKDGSITYKAFSLTQNGQRYYAAVRESLYDYYKNAFQNHSLTLKGKYQFTAGDGALVVDVLSLVEGEKETNLISYLWALNKGSAKNPNFKAYADLKGDGLILSVSKDGKSITINSNPWGASSKSQAYKTDLMYALFLVENLNADLDLPDWLYTEITETRAVDGRQKEVFDYVTVTWSYSVDSGLNIVYRKNS